MIAKIRKAIKLAVFGQGELLNGHAHRCYVPNGKGRNVLRVDYCQGEITVLAGSTKHVGGRDVTALVRSAFQLAQSTEFGMVNPHMAVALDNEIACPIRMVPVQ